VSASPVRQLSDFLESRSPGAAHHTRCKGDDGLKDTLNPEEAPYQVIPIRFFTTTGLTLGGLLGDRIPFVVGFRI